MNGGLLEGFLAALAITIVTTPVGVSGAVFLLPVQLDLLHVPNPSVTPTNLLYNVVAGPGALLRYRRAGRLTGPLTRQLLAGTLPGVMVGAVARVYLVPGPRLFRLVAATVLLTIGTWLVRRSLSRSSPAPGSLSSRQITMLAVVVGAVGGIYGIGGGSILGPLLVGSGLAVGTVAPAALASTFVTSIGGSAAYVLLAIGHSGSIAPVWSTGVSCGIGGMIGGYLGARLQPLVPEVALRLLLGIMAIGVSLLYSTEALR